MSSDAQNRMDLGGYLLDGLLLQGKYTSLYTATQPKLDRTVVVKVLNPKYADDIDVLGDFRDEVNIGTMLNHPNIVKIHDAGEKDGYHYYSMDLLHEGVLGGQAVRDLYSSIERCLTYFRGMTEGLKYALEQGMHHGELSSDMVFVNPAGEAKLFGFKYPAEDIDLLDVDVKALGCVFYEMLSGEKCEPDSIIDPLHKNRQDVTPFLTGLVTEMVSNGSMGRIRSYEKLLKDIDRARVGRSGSALFNRKVRNRFRRS